MVRVRTLVGSLVVASAIGVPVVHAADQQPPAPVPGQGPTTPAQPGAPAGPAQPRTFNAPAGVLFNTVRPERVADFEKVMAYLQAALENSTDPNVREMAKGWRVFKAAETGPGGVVLYVYLIDPTVVGADYGIGKILADAYPDQINQIWKLYTGAVTGGTLVNLTPVKPVPPPPLAPVPGQKP